MRFVYLCIWNLENQLHYFLKTQHYVSVPNKFRSSLFSLFLQKKKKGIASFSLFVVLSVYSFSVITMLPALSELIFAKSDSIFLISSLGYSSRLGEAVPQILYDLISVKYLNSILRVQFWLKTSIYPF